MNYLDKFRYSFDNLDEVNTKPKIQKKLIIKKFENLFKKELNLFIKVFFNKNLFNLKLFPVLDIQ